MQQVLIHQNLLKWLIYIDKFKNVPINLNNLKSKVDKLDVDKLVPISADLRKLSVT